MNRSTLKYLFFLGIAIALFYWKTLLTSQFTSLVGPEAVNYTFSWLRFWVNSLQEGRLPLWDPYAFCGRPFAGEMLPSAFYPLHLPLLLVPFDRYGLFPLRVYHIGLALTHLLCAYFMFALIRELRLSRYAAFLAACTFSLSGLMAQMVWPPFVEAGIWLPAIFLFLLRAIRARPRRSVMLEASLCGLCLGMSILTGGLHFSIMQGIFVATAAAFYGLSAPALPPVSRQSLWAKVALIVVIVVAVAGGTGAVQLLSSHEYGSQSLRYIDGGPLDATVKIPYNRLHPGMWPQSIVTTLFPFAFDGQIGSGESWAIYVGIFPLILAIIAIWKHWNYLWVRYLAGLAVLAFLYTIAEFSLLHGVLYALVPYLWVVRVGTRFVYLASFALAVLAAFGIDSILNRANTNTSWLPARRFMKWIAIACAAALFAPAIYNQWNIGSWSVFSLILILASCGIFAYLTTKEIGPWARVILVAFILFDLSAFQWLETNIGAAHKPNSEYEQMLSLKGVADFIKAQPGLGRVKVEVNPEPNIGDAYGVHALWGGGGTVLKSYDRLRDHDHLLNVRYLVKPASVADTEPIYQDSHWKVFENPEAYPRAWVVHDVVTEESQVAVFGRLGDPSIDLRQVALLEAPLPRALGQGQGANAVVRFQNYEPDRLVLNVTMESDGLLVLSEMHYPGWRASLNGEATQIHRVNGGLRGIVVPGGTSSVVLEYVPLTVYAGGAISLLTFFGVLLMFGLSRRWNEPAADPPASQFEIGQV